MAALGSGGGWGRGGSGGAQEKRGRRCSGGGRIETGSRILKVAGSGRICNRKSAKKREPTKIGQEPGLKGTGDGRFKSPVPFPRPQEGP